MRVSVVLPLYRTRATIGPLLAELQRSLDGHSLELVAVDDACPEGSGTEFECAARRLGVEHRLLRHQTNEGQNAAVLHGLAAASGEAIVCMDADLQDPPAIVPALIRRLAEGDEVAWGLRRGRHEPALRRACSWVFKVVLLRLVGSPLPPSIGLFFAVTPAARDALLAAARPRDYVVGALARLRSRGGGVEFDRQARAVGTSAYTAGARMRLALRALWAGARPHGSAVVATSLALACLARLAWLVHRNSVDVPYMDEWDIYFPLLSARERGTLASAIWEQTNEHRLVLSRLTFLALLPFTRGSTAPHHWLNVILATATWLLLWRGARATQRLAGQPASAWLPLALALLAFSPRMWELWTLAAANSFQMALLTTAGLFLLTLGGLAATTAAFALGVATSLCLASGFAFFPAGLVAMLGRGGAWRARLLQAGAWIAATAAAMFVFFHGWRPALATAPLTTGAIRDAALFALAYLAGPFGPMTPTVAVACGAGAMLIAAALIAALRNAHIPGRALAPWMSLGVFSLLCAAGTAFGRLSLGLTHSQSARYAALSTPFWMMMAVFFALWHATWTAQAAPRRARLLGGALAIVVALALLSRQQQSIREWARHGDRLRAARAELPDVCPGSWERFQTLHPDPSTILDAYRDWRGTRLTAVGDVDFDSESVLAPAPRAGAPAMGGVDVVRRVEDVRGGTTLDCLEIAGHVAPSAGADEVAIVEGGRVLKRVELTRFPPDSAQRFQTQLLSERLRPGASLSVVAVGKRGRTPVRIGPEAITISTVGPRREADVSTPPSRSP